MIIKIFTITVQMKEGDPNCLTEHIEEMFRLTEIRSPRGKVDFKIKKITIRRQTKRK